MPHVVYVGAFILCPWQDCGFRIELIDFKLESMSDPVLYAIVMSNWGMDSQFGLIGRCPGCKQFVRFGLTDKSAVADPSQNRPSNPSG